MAYEEDDERLFLSFWSIWTPAQKIKVTEQRAVRKT